MAESVGFEPTVPLRAHTISSRAQSSTLATLRDELNGRRSLCDPFVAVFRSSGGESGIRTHDEVAPIPVFETGALNRSATSPRTYDYSRRTGRLDPDAVPRQGLFKVMEERRLE